MLRDVAYLLVELVFYVVDLRWRRPLLRCWLVTC